MVDIILTKSNKAGKKYDAVTENEKTVSFGASGYSDFTKHKDEGRKKNYIARHKPNQDWKDHTAAGLWAKNILWNKPTIEASVKDTNKKFPSLNMKVKYLLKEILIIISHCSYIAYTKLHSCRFHEPCCYLVSELSYYLLRSRF